MKTIKLLILATKQGFFNDFIKRECFYVPGSGFHYDTSLFELNEINFFNN
jgi:hypothetical protein